MLKVRQERQLETQMEWQNGQDVFNWWIEEYKYNVKGQITIEEWMKSESEEV